MDIFEILVPLVFAAIYFFGNMFSKKSEDEEVPGEAPRPRKGEDPEMVERQRNIQEEIRRKIMQRREAKRDGGSRNLAPESTQGDETNADRQFNERRAAAESRRREETISQNPYPASQNPDPASRNPTPETRPSDGSFSWDQSDAIYDNEMKDRLKKIEATNRRAEKLKQQTEARRDPQRGSTTTKNAAGGALLQGSVVQNLRSANAARAAFIYGEVLGPPISQRKAQSVPGLER